jgi:1-deoxy-D-xylulose-5-phosphate synthase
LETRDLAMSEGFPPPAVVDLRVLKPLDTDTLDELMDECGHLVVVEDAYVHGGIGEQIALHAMKNGKLCRVDAVGVPDRYIPHATVAEQWVLAGLTAEHVLEVRARHDSLSSIAAFPHAPVK